MGRPAATSGSTFEADAVPEYGHPIRQLASSGDWKLEPLGRAVKEGPPALSIVVVVLVGGTRLEQLL
ncbi:MAG: hypothetical protein ACYTGV_20400, partial [Planctomycetota bacterium]